MNARLPWNRATLTEHDLDVLGEVEEALAGSPVPDGATDSLRWFAARLVHASLHPDAAFLDRLQAHLAGQLPARAKPSRLSFALSTLAARGVPVLAGVLALAVAIGVALPAVGDSTFKRIKLRESATPPPFSGRPSDFPEPPELTWLDPAELSRQVGMTVFVPDYLPEGCEKWGSWGYNREPIPPSVYLQYSCVVIGTVSGSRIGREVPAGSLSEITIAGHPALYQRGVWVFDPRTGTQKWSDSQTIYLERENGIVTLTSVRTITKDELIKVAESLRPVSAR